MCEVFLDCILQSGSKMKSDKKLSVDETDCSIVGALNQAQFLHNSADDSPVSDVDLEGLYKSPAEIEDNNAYSIDSRVISALDGYAEDKGVSLKDKLLLASLFFQATSEIFKVIGTPLMASDVELMSKVNIASQALPFLLFTARLENTRIFSCDGNGVMLADHVRLSLEIALELVQQQKATLNEVDTNRVELFGPTTGSPKRTKRSHTNTYSPVDDGQENGADMKNKPSRGCCSIFSFFNWFSSPSNTSSTYQSVDNSNKSMEL